MTFSYSYRVTSVRLFGLGRLLAIWKASVYKLVFRELLIFALVYAGATCLYRFGLNKVHKRLFEKIVVYCGTFESILPVTFVLGFYVSIVVQRWWSQFMNIPWPDRIMSYISILIPGMDETTVMLRRTIIRYLLLSEVLLLMAVSAPIKKRFPDVQSLVAQGLMTKEEFEMYNDEKVPHVSSKYWLPTHWCAMLFGRARREKRIRDNFSLSILLNELSTYKSCLGTVFSYDWISLPLVYTQVATIAVYGFFFNTIISRQYLDHTSVKEQFGPEVSAKYAIDLYVPIDTLLQLFFYLGWLKVAEQMLNPFGEDDDDFECNFIVDRNLKVGLYAVDQMLAKEPTLQRDVWWSSEDPQLQYTQASEKFAMTDGWFGSTANITVPQETVGTIPRLPGIPEASRRSLNGNDGGEEEDEDQRILSGNSSPLSPTGAGGAVVGGATAAGGGAVSTAADDGTLGSPVKANRRLPPLLQDFKKPFAQGKRGERRRTRTTTIESQLKVPIASSSTGLHSPSSELCHSLPDAQFRFALQHPGPPDAGTVELQHLQRAQQQQVTQVVELPERSASAKSSSWRARRRNGTPPPVAVAATAALDTVDGRAAVSDGKEEESIADIDDDAKTPLLASVASSSARMQLEAPSQQQQQQKDAVLSWMSQQEPPPTTSIIPVSSSACDLRIQHPPSQQQQQQQQHHLQLQNQLPDSGCPQVARKQSVDLPRHSDRLLNFNESPPPSSQPLPQEGGGSTGTAMPPRRVAFNPEVNQVEFHASRPAMLLATTPAEEGLPPGVPSSGMSGGAGSTSCLSSACSEDLLSECSSVAGVEDGHRRRQQQQRDQQESQHHEDV